MYGKFGRVNPPPRSWPSERAKALRQAVDGNSASVYGVESEIIRIALTEAGIPAVEVKQLELALTSEALRKLLTSENGEPTPVEINHAVLSVEESGLADDDARDAVEDLLYSIRVETVLRDYSAVRTAAAGKEAEKYIPPQVYRKRLGEIMGFVSQKDENALTFEVLEELNQCAECGISEANYILGLMYYDGIGVPRNIQLSYEYVKKADAGGYPPAYALLGDHEFLLNHFDEAFAYYTKPGAIALNKDRRSRMNTLLRARGFANKVCVSLGVLYAALVSAMLFLIDGLFLPGGRPAVLTAAVAVMTLLMAGVVCVHVKKPLKDLRQWGIAFALVFTLYTVFALI